MYLAWISRLRFGLALAIVAIAVAGGLTVVTGVTAMGLLASTSLVALCLLLPISVPPLQVSLAHAVTLGMMFIYGPLPGVWAGLGGLFLAAGVDHARAAWRDGLRRRLTTAHGLASEINQQGLPILAAGGVYTVLAQPLTATGDWGKAIVAGLAYLALFNFALALEHDFRAPPIEFRRPQLILVAALEIIPLPIAYYAATTYIQQGSWLMITLGGTLVAMALSLYGLARTQERLRRQVRENIHLYEAAQARLREQAILHEAGMALTSTLDRRALYHTVAEKLAEVIGAEECALLDCDEVLGVVRTVFQWRRSNQAPRIASQNYGLDLYPEAARLLRERTPLSMHADSHATPPALAAKLKEAGYGVQLILPLIASDQVAGMVELYCTRARNFTGTELRLTQTLANQAAIVIANARLFHTVRESRDRLAAVLNSTREGVLVVNSSGLVSLVNPPLEEFWGIPAEQLVDQHLISLVDKPGLDIAAKLGFKPDEVVELLLSLKAGLAFSIPKIQYEISHPRPRFLERSGAPILDTTSRAIGWVITLRDVSDERKIQEDREALSNMIVHDLRGPLAAVMASLQLIHDNFEAADGTPIVTQALGVAEHASEQLIGLVNTLLDVARMETGELALQPAPLKLHELVSEVIASMLSLAQENNTFLINAVPADLPVIVADREKVGRVVMNLVDNALKFTPAGGQVRIEALETRLPGEVRVLQCSVLDTGPGIPEEYRTRVFDRFAQVAGRKGRRASTGLGLAFCKLAVEAHGGRIWVDNRPAGGSAFRFTLPVSNGQA